MGYLFALAVGVVEYCRIFLFYFLGKNMLLVYEIQNKKVSYWVCILTSRSAIEKTTKNKKTNSKKTKTKITKKKNNDKNKSKKKKKKQRTN